MKLVADSSLFDKVKYLFDNGIEIIPIKYANSNLFLSKIIKCF